VVIIYVPVVRGYRPGDNVVIIYVPVVRGCRPGDNVVIIYVPVVRGVDWATTWSLYMFWLSSSSATCP
jgi:hypothetical protein